MNVQLAIGRKGSIDTIEAPQVPSLLSSLLCQLLWTPHLALAKSALAGVRECSRPLRAAPGTP